MPRFGHREISVQSAVIHSGSDIAAFQIKLTYNRETVDRRRRRRMNSLVWVADFSPQSSGKRRFSFRCGQGRRCLKLWFRSIPCPCYGRASDHFCCRCFGVNFRKLSCRKVRSRCFLAPLGFQSFRGMLLRLDLRIPRPPACGCEIDNDSEESYG
jgi:hypothetical protein